LAEKYAILDRLEAMLGYTKETLDLYAKLVMSKSKRVAATNDQLPSNTSLERTRER
jgi:hypothetical protein